jgi:uncharacterized repeat protein (TIGR01451 family)
VSNVGIASSTADLSVMVQDQPDPVQAGGDVTYQIEVSNAGPLSATGIRLTSVLPAATSFASVSAPAGWSCSASTLVTSDTVSCTYAPALAAGGSSSVEVVARVAACTTAVELRNEVQVASSADENDSNNQATGVTAVADPAPVVDLTQPNGDQTGLPNVNYPVTVRWNTSGPSPVVDEKVYLDSCLLWDGDVYGDRDGLLSDEYQLRTNKYLLCQAMARCGLTVLYNPRLRVVAEDACGRWGEDSVIYRKRLLKTEVCGR